MTSITVLPGDGIGPEVTYASLPVIEKSGLKWDLKFGEIGWECWRNNGDPVPPETWNLLEKSDACLLGAITSKPIREAELELPKELQGSKHRFISPVIQLRQRLNLFANVRPINGFRYGAFNFAVIRENTEGLYAGFDFHNLDETMWNFVSSHPNALISGPENTSVTLRLQTMFGIDRLLRFAFEYAEKHNYKTVTVADKPNVLRNSSNFLRERLELISSEYPHIISEVLNVDAIALWIVRRPEKFGVIVAENMFGDILSDLGAGIMGGLGLASSGNIGDYGNYFEPVHGSAPSMAGKGKANPFAMILTIAQLAEQLGSIEQSQLIRAAVKSVISKGINLTYDLEGNSGTAEAAAAVVEEI